MVHCMSYKIIETVIQLPFSFKFLVMSLTVPLIDIQTVNPHCLCSNLSLASDKSETVIQYGNMLNHYTVNKPLAVRLAQIWQLSIVLVYFKGFSLKIIEKVLPLLIGSNDHVKLQCCLSPLHQIEPRDVKEPTLVTVRLRLGHEVPNVLWSTLQLSY